MPASSAVIVAAALTASGLSRSADFPTAVLAAEPAVAVSVVSGFFEQAPRPNASPNTRQSVTVDARVVVSSVDTFLRFAEATNRLDLAQAGGLDPIGTVVGGAAEVVEEVAAEVVDRKVTSAVETVSDKVDSAAAVAEEKVDSAVGKVTALVDSERGGEPTR